MNKAAALLALESLSSEIRLDIYRRLVKRGPRGMVAGEIGTALQMQPSNLTFHLKALTGAGLLTVASEGRFQRYRAHLPTMSALISYLMDECCADHPEQCVTATDLLRGKATRTGSAN